MGFFDRLKRLIRLQSIDNQSIHPSQQEQHYENQPISEAQQSPIEIERDSLQLGLAAGYTGRSIRDIDSSLNRIETQMVTKDWLEIRLQQSFKQHENITDLRFNRIEHAIAPLLKLLSELPRTVSIIQTIENIRLTRRMQEVLDIIKMSNEVSYTDLAMKLGIQQDNLRGLLSKIAKRTDKIQRFERDNNGWVRWISDFNQQSIDKTQENVEKTLNQGSQSTQNE